MDIMLYSDMRTILNGKLGKKNNLPKTSTDRSCTIPKTHRTHGFLESVQRIKDTNKNAARFVNQENTKLTKLSFQ